MDNLSLFSVLQCKSNMKGRKQCSLEIKLKMSLSESMCNNERYEWTGGLRANNCALDLLASMLTLWTFAILQGSAGNLLP